MKERELRFWRVYHEIEKAVPYDESKFVSSVDIFEWTITNINHCLEIVVEAARELTKELGIDSNQNFEELMWSLGRAGVLGPMLLADALDVYSLIKKTGCSVADKSTIYSSLVRVMEVLEATWKEMEKALGNLAEP